jgi:Ca2+-transporting ATPase
MKKEERRGRWYALSKKEVLQEIGSREEGLDENEARRRLAIYGRNNLPEDKNGKWIRILLREFNSLLIYILIFSAVVSFLIGHYIDSGVIIVIIIVNASIGFFQEYEAERTIEDLKKILKDRTIVLRAGKEEEIDIENLVPGDILILKEGDKICADCRILKAINLEMNEAILTGESFPIEKTDDKIPAEKELQERTNMIYSGTTIIHGNGMAVVIATGKETEFGKIATLLKMQSSGKSLFEKKLNKFTKKLSGFILILTGITFLLGTFFGNKMNEMFLMAVSMAIGAIPEGLPAVIAITLAIAVKQMEKENTLIRKLPAAESLGSIDIICVDKTGTLTEEKLRVEKIFAGNKFLNEKEKSRDLDQLVKTAVLCNNAREEDKCVLGEPTEIALINFAKKFGVNKKKETEKEKRVREFCFTSERKMMSIVRENGERISYVKGAPFILIERCTKEMINGKIVLIDKKRKTELERISSEMASSGLRVLAFAFKNIPEKQINEKNAENNLVFLGFLGMVDPPRKEIKESVRQAKEAGIEIKILTGDAKETAVYVGKQIGIDGEVIEGREMDLMDEGELREIVLRTRIFARINPEHKLKIVEILKSEGKSIAVTGDGVNDVLALKKADIGIAMGIRGTDIARDSSDIILLDDNFASIIKGIKQGRRVYDNLKKSIKFHLSANFYLYFVILFTFLFALPLPMFPLAILWMNLVTDSFPSLAFAAEPAEENILKKKPKKENLLDGIAKYILAGGIVGFAIVFSVFLIGLKFFELETARTMTMTSAIMFELFFAFSCKSEHNGLRYIFNNKYLIYAVLISFGLHLIALYTPLAGLFGFVPISLMQLLGCIFAGFMGFVFFEGWKVVKGKIFERK